MATSPKSIGVTAIMNDPKISLQVKEALDSPPGSSKRTNALAVLRSINKTVPLSVSQAPAFQGSLAVQNAPTAPSMRVSPQVSTMPSTAPTSPALPSQPSTQSTVGGMDLQGGAQPGLQGMATPASRFIFQAAPTKKESILPSDVATQNGKPTEEFKSWYDRQTPEVQEKYKVINDAVEAGVGKETFAWEMMADINKFRKLPGMENTPADALPVGGSLTRQTQKVESALREEMGLNQKVDNLKKLSERGLTIEDNLNDYVMARDKYLKNIDSMIDGAKSSMIDMDLGNPYVADRMNKYMNYLYILKGRQTKRYANFLDSAIRQHNYELTRAQNDYNTTLDSFNRELASQKAITAEDYNRLNGMLQDMYTNVAGRDRKELEDEKLRQEVLKMQFENSGDPLARMTEAERNDIVNYEKQLGQKLSNTVWSVIFTNLSPTNRSYFIQRLKTAFAGKSGMSDEEVLKMLGDFISENETGGVLEWKPEYSTGG